MFSSVEEYKERQAWARQLFQRLGLYENRGGYYRPLKPVSPAPLRRMKRHASPEQLELDFGEVPARPAGELRV